MKYGGKSYYVQLLLTVLMCFIVLSYLDFHQPSKTGVQSFPMPERYDLIRALRNIDMCILQIEPGTCGVPLDQSLLSGKHNLSFKVMMLLGEVSIFSKQVYNFLMHKLGGSTLFPYGFP